MVSTMTGFINFPHTITVADPGFPVGGGRGPVRGAWASDVGAFWQKCMQK